MEPDRRQARGLCGQFVLIVLVGTVLSLVFWAIGLPYWLLLGAFAGVVEIVPVIGPLLAVPSRSVSASPSPGRRRSPPGWRYSSSGCSRTTS